MMGKTKDDDNPEWTPAMVRKARPAKEVFPGMALPKPRRRGAQKTPTKVQTTIRLDRDVVDHFKREGHGWQSRINAALRRVVNKKKKKSA
jgi:uncharacterized protein (DUF4415 family)